MVEVARGVGFGRVCLLGDHCDWAQRQVLASSIDRKIVTTASRRTDDQVGIKIANSVANASDEAQFSIRNAKDLPIKESSLKYVNAVAAAILERGLSLGGCNLDITSDIPVKKGLSSSAALCVSTARAFNELYSLGLSSADVVEISYRAENGLLGIGCGMMDQTAAAHEYPLHIDFQGTFRYERVFVKRRLPLLVVDVGGVRDTKLILNTLNHYYFEDKDPLIVKTLGEDIPKLVQRARIEMEGRCRLEKIGELMNQNQACYDRGLRPFCPEELDSPRLYAALELVLENGALGAKWTGAGGNGSIIVLSRDLDSASSLAEAVRGRYDAMVASVG